MKKEKISEKVLQEYLHKLNLDIDKITKIAKDKGFKVENRGNLGLSMITDNLSVSFLKRGSAVLIGTKDENDALSLYKELLGRKAVVEATK